MTIPPEVSEDTVFVELSREDAALLQDHASRRLTTLVPGGPMASAWRRVADAIGIALPPAASVTEESDAARRSS